jgi:hypothetical protein
VDTFLSLVIALGGIAMAIGAIWAAVLARRQLVEQRRFLGEQNDRTRLTLEFDLLTRLEERFEGQRFLARRRSAPRHALDAFHEKALTVKGRRVGRAWRTQKRPFATLPFALSMSPLRWPGA